MPKPYTGDHDVSVTEWVMQIGRWLRAQDVPEVQWIRVLSAHVGGAASRWMNLQELRMAEGRRQPFVDWQDWAAEARRQFEPTTSTERARTELRGLRQGGTVRDYVRRFQHICFRIPDMTDAEMFSTFVAGLRDPLRTTIAGFVRGDVQEAIEMAERLDGVRTLHPHSGARGQGGRPRWNRRSRVNSIGDGPR
ncbi:MAG: hypothetical protein Aurels2KO_57160 [Aureliella sp.]